MGQNLMQKKIAYDVIVRRLETGEDHVSLIFASDESIAADRALEKARRILCTTFVDRKYGQFEVVSCKKHVPA
jgi:hypothetical protein